LETLHQEGTALAEEFGAEQRERQKLYGKREPKKNTGIVIVRLGGVGKKNKKKEEEQVPEPLPIDETRFEERYQSWYSRALPLMKQLALDRYHEFQSFYVVDPRYPWSNTSAYVIQDYLRGREADDAGGETVRCFRNQLAILKSISDRLTWGQMDTDDQKERGMQLGFLETARNLIDINERAAGAMAGTVLETFLQKLTTKHQLKFRKQAPSLREYIDALHSGKVLDIPIHSQATWVAEIANRSRAPGESPTKPQVRDLIDGTQWLITHIF
jgi:hypothetical protein